MIAVKRGVNLERRYIGGISLVVSIDGAYRYVYEYIAFPGQREKRSSHAGLVGHHKAD